jgi:hypothetical protein
MTGFAIGDFQSNTQLEETTMCRMTYLVLAAAALAVLMAPTRAGANGAAHVGYTHVGPNGVYHKGTTVAAGPHGAAATTHTSAYGAGGGQYHSGAAAGGYHYSGGYAYGASAHYGYCR